MGTYFEKGEEENEKIKMKFLIFFIIYVVRVKVVSLTITNMQICLSAPAELSKVTGVKFYLFSKKILPLGWT